MLDMNKTYTIGTATLEFRTINFDKFRTVRVAVEDGKQHTLTRDHQVGKGGDRLRHLQSLEGTLDITSGSNTRSDTIKVNITVDCPADAPLTDVAVWVARATAIVNDSAELNRFLAKES